MPHYAAACKHGMTDIDPITMTAIQGNASTLSGELLTDDASRNHASRNICLGLDEISQAGVFQFEVRSPHGGNLQLRDSLLEGGVFEA